MYIVCCAFLIPSVGHPIIICSRIQISICDTGIVSNCLQRYECAEINCLVFYSLQVSIHHCLCALFLLTAVW
jgi:hypothetical protein